MPRKKRLSTGFNINAGDVNISLPGIPKTYTEMYNQTKTINNSNTPVEVFKFSDTLAGDSFLNAKQLVLVNEGYGGLEVQIKYDAWANGTPDTNGSAVYTNFLLGEGEYLTFNNSKIVNFDENSSAANAYTRDNDSITAVGYTESGALLDGAINSTTTTITVDANDAYRFRPGDFIGIDLENDTWDDYGSMEIMKVISIDSATQFTVYPRNGISNTGNRAHGNNSKIYFCDFNHTPTLGGTDYQSSNVSATGWMEQDAWFFAIDNSIAKVENANGDYISDSDGDFTTAEGAEIEGYLPGIAEKRVANVKVEGGSVETTFITHTETLGGEAKAYVHIDNDIDATSAGTSTLISTLQTTTNKFGQYRSTNFPGGYGRTNSLVGSGLVPGSIAIKFATGGFASFGYSPGDRNQDSNLETGRQYRFDIQSDGRKETVEFMVGRDTSINGVFSKIMQAIDNMDWDIVGQCYFQFVIDGAGVYGLKSLSNMHTLNGLVSTPANQVPKSGASTIRLLKASSGSGHQLFGSGIFPAVPPAPTPTGFPPDTVWDEDEGMEVVDIRNFMVDDGNGNLYVTDDTHIDLASPLIYPGAGWILGPANNTMPRRSGPGRSSAGHKYVNMTALSTREDSGEHQHGGGEHDHAVGHKHQLLFPSEANLGATHSHSIPETGGDLDPYQAGNQTSRELFIDPTFQAGQGGNYPGTENQANYTSNTTPTANHGFFDQNYRLMSATYGSGGPGSPGHGHSGGLHNHESSGGGDGGTGDGNGSVPPVFPGIRPYPGVSNPEGKIYTGKIDYETGAIWIGWGPSMAEMQFSCSYNSALAGNAQHSSTAGNGIQSIYARSTNQKTNGKLKIIALR